MKLWTLRYKGLRGVQDVLIQASDEKQARAVSEAWLETQPGYRFISVSSAVVATEAILQKAPPEAVGAKR